MKGKIETVFEALKGLEILATPNNVSILNGVYSLLREIYNEMGERENAGTENRSEADSCGRDDN